MSVLWIVDRDSQRLGDAFKLLPTENASNIIVDNRRTTTLPQLAAEVRRRIQQPVNLVRIISHGDSGRLLFSNGTIAASNAGALQFLRGLVRQPPLVGAAGIEIHGCGVASDYLPPPRREDGIGNVTTLNYGNMQGQLSSWGGSPRVGISTSRGVNFLRVVAAVCGVAVKGGIDYQLPDAGWNYEGPTITVSPPPSRQGFLSDPQNRLGLGPLHTFIL